MLEIAALRNKLQHYEGATLLQLCRHVEHVK